MRDPASMVCVDPRLAESRLRELAGAKDWSIAGSAELANGLLGLASGLGSIGTADALTGETAEAAKQVSSVLAGQLTESAAWVDKLNGLISEANAQRAAAQRKLQALPPAEPHPSVIESIWNSAVDTVTGSHREQEARQAAADARAVAAQAHLDTIQGELGGTAIVLAAAALAPPPLGNLGEVASSVSLSPSPVAPAPKSHKATTSNGTRVGAVPTGSGLPPAGSTGSDPGAGAGTPTGTTPGSGGTGSDLNVDGSMSGTVPGSGSGSAGSGIDWANGGSTHGLAGTSGGNGLAGGLVGGAAMLAGSRIAGEGTSGFAGLGSSGLGGSSGARGLGAAEQGGLSGARGSGSGLGGARGSSGAAGGRGLSGAGSADGAGSTGSRAGLAAGEANGAGSGAAGARGTSGMFGGQQGAGSQDKQRRRGLGGPIAPKLEDAEELGPRSAAAGPGSR
jgi:hypothetical protein